MMLTLAWGIFGVTIVVAVLFGILYWFGLSRTHLDRAAITKHVFIYAIGASLILALMLILPL